MKKEKLSKRIASNPWFQIIGWFIGLASLIIALFSNNVLQLVAGLTALVLTVVGAAFFVYRHFSVKRYSSGLETKVEKYFEEIHKICHNLRDITQAAKMSKYDEENFKHSLMTICDYLEKLLDLLYNEEVCVCIKQIDIDCLESSIDKWKTQTICRSRNTSQDRKVNDDEKFLISGDTILMSILSPNLGQNLPYYACPDLEKTIQRHKDIGQPFLNNRHEDVLNHYKSTIVVPIRAKQVYVDEQIVKRHGIFDYHVFGFLCIDSMQVFPKESGIFGSAIQCGKAVADMLYPVFESYLLKQLSN